MVSLKRPHALPLRIVLAIIISAALWNICVVQEVAFIDLAQTTSDTELRRPATHDGKSVESFRGTRDGNTFCQVTLNYEAFF
jgi:hypothetical protein